MSDRIQPTIPTLKKLFALSGNKCAFPDCNLNLFDNEGHFIGQICHIEAANKTGKRFNSNLSPKERAEFNNLIILCANHHLITDDEEKYPVDVLKQMKSDHESNFYDQPYNVTDTQLDTVLQNYYQSNFIENGTQIITQSGDIHYGLSYADAVSLFKDLLKNEITSLQDIARMEANRRIESFTNEFYDSLIRHDEVNPLLQNFKDPAVQLSIKEAYLGAIKRNDEDINELLVKLLLERLGQISDIKCIVLDEAISTIPKLTKDQLNSLAFYECTQSLKFNGDTIEEFNSFLGYIHPFISSQDSHANLMHLMYTSCIQLLSLHTRDKQQFIVELSSNKFDFETIITKTQYGESIVKFYENMQFSRVVPTSIGIYIGRSVLKLKNERQNMGIAGINLWNWIENERT